MQMRYSKGVEQALHALVVCIEIPQGFIGVNELAKYFQISPSYLSKIFTKLAKAGILCSVPGVKGGYSFAKKAAEITFWDVVEAIEGKSNFFQCTDLRFNAPEEIKEALDLPKEILAAPCLIHSTFLEAEEQLRKTLQNKTLASIHEELSGQLPEIYRNKMKSYFQNRL
jgi:Rrf2 family protein